MRVESANRSPGVYFQREPRSEPTALPRMDVAAFVGFAAQGPLHLPVVVEDIARFREIFGQDLALAWDPERKRTQYSQLGAAVELFFRNGGRRCWIVRVAQADGENAARVQDFRVPGLFMVSGTFSPARVRARCPGGWAGSVSVRSRLDGAPLPVRDFSVPASPGVDYVLDLASVPFPIETGELVELRWSEARLRAFLFVDSVETTVESIRLRGEHVHWFEGWEALGSPAGSPDVEPPGGLLPLSEAEGLNLWAMAGSPAELPRARARRFTLQAWEGERMLRSMGELGFDARHPRYWGALPDDAQLFGEILGQWKGGDTLRLSELAAESLHPRFALAGGDSAVGRSLPLEMNDAAEPGTAVGYVGGSSTEGLMRFDASLFLDPDLAVTTLATLAGEAKHKAEVLGLPLTGLHSLWSLSEVSMIAVPDASHRHWDRSPRPGDPPLSAPWMEDISALDERGRRVLSWSAVPSVRRYRVQVSETPDFEFFEEWRIDRPSRLELLNDAASDGEPDHELLVTLDEGCPRDHYFRVRAVGYYGSSAWSNTLALRVPESAFHDCARAAVEALGLVLEVTAAPEPGVRRLHWVAESPAGLDPRVNGFELQNASESDFTALSLAYAGGLTQHDVLLEAAGRQYFRVRAVTPGGPGPWSNTIILDPDALRTETLHAVESYDSGDLLAVQRALVRLCATRADTVALLGAPAHYRDAELNRHLTDLGVDLGYTGTAVSDAPVSSGTSVPRLRWDEREALGYAALFHPWLRRGEPEPYRGDMPPQSPDLASPEGPATGLLAAQARIAGAWISAANRPLVDVLGLSPQLEEVTVASLSVRGVNVVYRGPRGFLLTRTDTLSANGELRPLSVRRLMTLLRRLIAREGNRYVFEPNSFDFREAVRDQWEDLLQDLYVRGALRGSTPDAAFRVVTDLSVNDVRAVEQGRFVVELHVAPSQPLRFLNVRLVQSGPDQLLVQEL